MGAKDDTEKVLRDIHVMFSKAQPYHGSSVNVIVNKNDMLDLLKKLNDAMYGMMDEYELTVAARDKAERDQKKKADEIILEARRKAEDVYAASIMYTDQALNGIQDIMKQAADKTDEITRQTQDSLNKEIRNVKSNQSELKGQLQDLIDTQKYMKLIDDENRRLAKAKEQPAKMPPDDNVYADVQPEIHVNEQYLNRMQPEETSADLSQEAAPAAAPVSSEDLDQEYFDWKAPEKEEKRQENTVEKVLSIFNNKTDKT